MNRFVFALVASLFSAGAASAATVPLFDYRASTDVAPQSVVSGASVSSISQVGLDKIGTLRWDDFSNASTKPTTDYLEWTFTPTIGKVFDFATMDIRYRSSAQGGGSQRGPRDIAIEVSVDGGTYASVHSNTTLGSTGQTHSINLSALTDVSVSATFRLYGWDAQNGNGVFTLEDMTEVNSGTGLADNSYGTAIIVYGDDVTPVTYVPVPPALPLLAAGVGGLAILRRRRRRAA